MLIFRVCMFCSCFLLLLTGARPGKQVQLLEGEIKMLCVKARDIFMQQPILLELEAPIKICGEFCCMTAVQTNHVKHVAFVYSRTAGRYCVSIPDGSDNASGTTVRSYSKWRSIKPLCWLRKSIGLWVKAWFLCAKLTILGYIYQVYITGTYV